MMIPKQYEHTARLQELCAEAASLSPGIKLVDALDSLYYETFRMLLRARSEGKATDQLLVDLRILSTEICRLLKREAVLYEGWQVQSDAMQAARTTV